MREPDTDAADREVELLKRFDAASFALGSWVSRAENDGPHPVSNGAGTDSPRPEDAWRERWVLEPLRAAAAFEALSRELGARLAILRMELETVEGELARTDARASHDEYARLETRRSELVDAILALKSKLRADDESAPSPARLGPLLQRVFRRLACEVFCLVREDLNEAAARARAALTRIEEYERLSREARHVAGPLSLPGFSQADLEAVRRQAGQTVVHLHDLAS